VSEVLLMLLNHILNVKRYIFCFAVIFSQQMKYPLNYQCKEKF